MSALPRRIGRIAVAATLAVVTFAGLAILGLSQSGESVAAAGADQNQPPRPAPPHGKFVVALVLGQSGSDTGDVFAPYEVLASSPNFFVYTVAATSSPAPVDGAMSIVPSYTFADVAAGVAAAPSVIVVPAVNSPAGPSEAPARDFIAQQYSAGARVLGICAGSRLLAASGILAGHHATSHWSRISALETSNPEVMWIRGQRYVQDGLITTTAGVTSSIPGTLKVMADIAGSAEATRVGEAIRYPRWSLEAPTSIPSQSFGIEDAAVLLDTAFPWARPSIGVELRDGVSEIDAGALFEVYSYSQVAIPLALSRTGTITTAHGLVIKTADLGGTRGQILVAGHLDTTSTGGFDAAFEQLSRSTSPTVVDSVGKMLEYPLDRVTRESAPPTVQLRPAVLLLLSLAIAVAIGSLPSLIRKRRKRD